FAISFASFSDGSFSSAKGFFRATVGRAAAATTALWASPGEAGVGLEITNGFKLTILTRNNAGTLTRTNTNISVTHANFTKHTVILHSVGDGTVNCYYDGNPIGKATGGPTTVTGVGDDGIHVEAANGGDASNNAWVVYSLKTMQDD